ncbi:MAG: outer membrane beta-barrel protein [Pseudomonadota bacterium]
MKFASTAALAAALLLAGTAHAETIYAGLSRTTPGEYYADFGSAQHIENGNSLLSLKLYGGIDLTERYAIEAGYGAFGTLIVSNPAAGSKEEARTSPTLMYVAGKATLPVGASFTVFGKLGLAANRVTFENRNGAPAPSTSAFVRPMYGFGADYQLTKHVAAVLEYDYYGASANFKQQKLELGVKFSF